MKILILGANGFIGSHLAKRILATTDWSLTGLDLHSNRLNSLHNNPRFALHKGDVLQEKTWVEQAVKANDVVLPLIAIATPASYVEDPLHVFELDFEENLKIVRLCVQYQKRLIFPSTSEVYGMCEDEEFDEDQSNLVLGPIRKSRWIYSCSKQLLDRVIWAYGEKHNLQFTLIRPFNWLGPDLDSIEEHRSVRSRSLSEFIANLFEGRPIRLVDGGEQRRAFLDISDGIDCLMKIIADRGAKTNGQILNIGFPQNEYSIAQLAEMTRNTFQELGGKSRNGKISAIEKEASAQAYGAGYQDVMVRRPAIRKAQELLQWTPKIRLPETVRRTVSFYLEQYSP